MEKHMPQQNASLQLRKKMLGIRIRDARVAARKSVRETAEELGVTTSTLKAIESGRRPITLPELEALAYAYDVPIRHFLRDSQFLSTESREKVDMSRRTAIRQKMIATKLRQLRESKRMRLGELSKKSELSIGRIKSYEMGNKPIPLLDLEALSIALEVEMDYFLDFFGPVGQWAQDRESDEQFQKLPLDVRQFVAKPLHEPYLRLAMRLSELPVSRLRDFAETLLDITL
jgi:transcriptional regulator with XRE-family HTH domain